MDFKDMFAEHDNQVVLSNQMILFRQEYMDMRSEVENQLSRLQLDCSAMTREASCSFALLLSQMGCPSCSSGVIYLYLTRKQDWRTNLTFMFGSLRVLDLDSFMD